MLANHNWTFYAHAVVADADLTDVPHARSWKDMMHRLAGHMNRMFARYSELCADSTDRQRIARLFI